MKTLRSTKNAIKQIPLWARLIILPIVLLTILVSIYPIWVERQLISGSDFVRSYPGAINKPGGRNPSINFMCIPQCSNVHGSMYLDIKEADSSIGGMVDYLKQEGYEVDGPEYDFGAKDEVYIYAKKGSLDLEINASKKTERYYVTYTVTYR